MLQTNRYFTLFAILLCSLLLSSCSALAAEHYVEQKISFSSGTNQLSGALIVPKTQAESFPVVVFVHGDGPMPYRAHGYYSYLWEQLAKHGIGALSWDKAGVGGSSGDWLKQSMTDRANEVVDAITFLNSQPVVDPDQIGIIGYSQAGWVLPIVADLSDQPAFMVFVSPAINWVEESDFQGEKRLRRDGLDEATIAALVECGRQGTERLLHKTDYSYNEYLTHWKANCGLAHGCDDSPMSAQRLQFVKLNVASDMRDNMGDIQVPVLALFGEQDELVNVANSVTVFNEYFGSDHDFTLKVFANATHGMLRADKFTDLVGISEFLQLEMMGESAFTEGFLELMATWVEQQTQAAQ